MDRPRPTRFRFGSFEADLGSGELFENEKLVPLQSKPFQFLATLLRNYGELVTREAISHSLWPDIYVQVNQGLNAAARKVRMALHDDAIHPTFIETVGGRGYRFIHPTEVLRWSTELEVADRPARVAVLQFCCESQEDVELAGGLSRQLVGELRGIHPRLIALAGADLAWVSNPDKKLEPLRKMMEVTHVLSGTCSRHSRRLALSVSLEAVQDKVRVWEKKYDIPAREITTALHDVSVKVLQHLRNVSANAVATPSLRTPCAGYEDFLRGQHYLGQKPPMSIKTAAQKFQKSSELDGNFVPSLVGVAKSYNLLGMVGAMEPRVAYMTSMQAAKRALAVDPKSAEAMVELGWSTLTVHRDWATATRLFEQSLQLRPNMVSAHCKYAFLLLSRMRVDDALARLRQARRIAVAPAVNNELAMSYYFSRRYDDAITEAELSLAMDGTSSDAHALMGISLLAKQRLNAALEHFQSALEHANGDAVSIARLAYAQAHAGRFEIAAGMLKKIESQYETLPAYDMALVRLALGNVNEAFGWLETAYQQCSHWVLLMRLDPRLDLLRGSRRFDQLNRMLLPMDARKAAGAS